MARKLANRHGATLVREAYPGHMHFEKKDGLYYLRGKDLAQVTKALGLECESSIAVGFDEVSLSVCIR